MMKKLLFLALAICLVAAVKSQNTDSLVAITKSQSHDTIKLNALSELSWQLASSDPDKALNFANEQLQLSQKINSKKHIARSYNDIGIVLIRKSSFHEALKNHQQALHLRLNLGNDNDIASSYSKIAYCNNEISDYPSALEAALPALTIYEKQGNKIYQAYMLNTLSSIYTNLSRFDKLMQTARKSYALAKEMEDKNGMATALNYIANAYAGQKKFDEAIKNEKDALALFTETGDSLSMASCLNNLGFHHTKKDDYQTALKYYFAAFDIAEIKDDPNSKAVYLHNIGNSYYNLGKYPEAEKYLNQSEKIASDQKMGDLRVLIYKSFGDLYTATGRPKQALEAYNKYAFINDSIFSSEMTSKLSEMQIKYETEKKEAANKLLMSENELKTAALSRGRLVQLFLVIGIALIILLSYLFYTRYKLKQKQILAKEMLHQQELRSKAVIEAEEKERVRIARELHDGIGQQLSAAKMNISGLEGALQLKTADEKTMLKNALDLLDESVKEVRAVSHSMMPNALIKSGLVSAVREFINKISSAGNLKINLEIIGLQQRLDPTVENVLFRVLQEIVNNIIKHSRANTVGIQFIKHDTELTVLVEDDGIGFNVAEQLKREDAGIGLKNIQSRIEYLNGEVIFDSYPGKGTTVTIEIPV